MDINNTLSALQSLLRQPPEIAIILGSGLGEFAEDLEEAQQLWTREIPGYPVSTVEGHAGTIVSGKISGKKLICFQGRVHLYEGYPLETVVFPISVAAALGAKVLILTNAAGGVHRHLKPGSLMLIEDQVDLQFHRRVFQLDKRTGKAPSGRWPIISGGTPYSERLMDIADRAALNVRIPLQRGVLGAMTGPSYETPAEVRVWMRLGVDAACMSTAAEAVEGARLGLEVLGISCITNRAAGLSDKPLNHAEVIEMANRVKGQFKTLIKEIIKMI